MNMHSAIHQAVENQQLSTEAMANIEKWLETEELPSWAKASLTELIEKEAWEELTDRFYKDISFGTGGMRGRTIGKMVTSAEKGSAKQGVAEHPMVGSNALNDFTLVRATLALYRYVQRFLKENGRFECPTLVIAHDVRHFSRRFCLLAASLWGKLGGMAMIFDGPRSTPHLSFTVRSRRAHAGIVITASHNPPHDNGFKAYFEDGAQVVSPQAEGIAEEYRTSTLREAIDFLETDENCFNVLPKEDDLAYLKVVEQAAIDPDVIQQEKPKVVFTPIHGTGGISSVPALLELGLDPIVVDEQNKQDPRFPTVKSPNPENPEALERGIALARKTGAMAVIATDPDSDRMGAAVFGEKKKAVVLNGNEISAILAEYRINKLKELECLPKEGTPRAAIIKTFVTSPLIDAIAKGQGLNCINTLTGFKWAGQRIRQYEDVLKNELYENEGVSLNYDETDYYTRLSLGIKYSKVALISCEESYGYLPYDFVRDKDANASIIAFCEILSYLKKSNITLIEYLDIIYMKYGYFDQKTINLYYDGAIGASKIQKIVNSYKTDPPQEISGIKVNEHKFYGEGLHIDADGESIANENFHTLDLENGYSMAVRASGTEPKIKFYLFGQNIAKTKDELPKVKTDMSAQLEKLGAFVESDARTRAED